MTKILINDGMHPTGVEMLRQQGYEVVTEKVEQDQLSNKLPDYDVLCVRSATKVRKELIDLCPKLKVVGRGGVGLDNIDVDYAKEKDIAILNTPAASSRSVAELSIAHMLSISRFLYKANRTMPSDGDSEFKVLKKFYSKGVELEGKILGIIGLGRIGQDLAKIALGMGMTVLAVDPLIDNATIEMEVADQRFSTEIKTVEMDYMLSKSDYISLHIPFSGSPVIGKYEFEKMKDGVILVNASRGGTVDENALLAALEDGKVAGAGLDVFEGEPRPRKDVMSHPNISLSPHIGASTREAQEKIGIELATKIISALTD